MGLYQSWQESIEKANPANAKKILEAYYEKEKNAYAKILQEPEAGAFRKGARSLRRSSASPRTNLAPLPTELIPRWSLPSMWTSWRRQRRNVQDHMERAV